MKSKNLLTALILGLSFFFAAEALATLYVVRVRNKSGRKIKVIYAKYKLSTWEKCHPFTDKKIRKNKTRRCRIANSYSQSKGIWRIRYKCNKKRYQQTSKKSWAKDIGRDGKKWMTTFEIGSDCKAKKGS